MERVDGYFRPLSSLTRLSTVLLTLSLLGTLFVAGLAATASGGPHGAATAPIRVLVSTTVSPAPQVGDPMAYDAHDGYSVLLGAGNATGPQNETWIFAHGQWTQLHPARSPVARGAASMAYDPRCSCLVLFGGLSNTSKFLNDTWTYSGGNWTQLSLSAAPSPRDGAGFVYDAAGGYLLLFGGGSPSSSSLLNDTWKFAHGHWKQLNPPTSPCGRRAAGMTYDASDRYVLLFAGLGCNGDMNDTWEYSNGTWTNLPTPQAPEVRVAPGLAYDGRLGRVILFGGRDDNSGVLPNDTWSFHAGSWTLLTPPRIPAPRFYPSFDFDVGARGILMFGGATWQGAFNAVNLNDTWVYAHGNWH